ISVNLAFAFIDGGVYTADEGSLTVSSADRTRWRGSYRVHLYDPLFRTDAGHVQGEFDVPNCLP
ncbi:MAG: hypothetical protein JNK82_19085, partial [Myxococcaceae bacterium]|nr:hypothetical protein [Myxococcaceae bacterium]